MTKNQKKTLVTILPFTIALMVFWIFGNSSDEAKLQTVAKVQSRTQTMKKTPFREPASVPQTVQLAVINHTKNGLKEPVWKEALEKNLVLQGNGNLKKAEIEIVDSFEWKFGHVPVKVDSLLVKLEHMKGNRTSFNAIVDSSNGKILQTWNHPLTDDFNSRKRNYIKIDPRYHNE
jgi:hypothetical protein